jgi:hypothetical protein
VAPHLLLVGEGGQERADAAALAAGELLLPGDAEPGADIDRFVGERGVRQSFID